MTVAYSRPKRADRSIRLMPTGLKPKQHGTAVIYGKDVDVVRCLCCGRAIEEHRHA